MPTPYDLFNYQKYWEKREYEDKAEKIALLRFLKVIGKSDSLIDVGGGFGRLTSSYLPFAKRIFLCEPSEKLLKIAKNNFSFIKKITFCQTSLPNLAFAGSTFDVAVIVRVMHHLQDSSKTIKELSRILKPGGYLILEFANKIHFLAGLRALIKGDFSFVSDLNVCEQRSAESIAKKKILFLNHHPKKIIKDLKSAGLEVRLVLSVSNFRHPIIKKIIPLKILIFLERITQRPLSFIYFGPSIFILACKSHNT